MHCEFPGKMGVIVQAITRFSVPFFFMVSGYYCFFPPTGLVPSSKMKKKVKHIGIITLNAVLFYIIVGLLSGKGYNLSLKRIISLLLFNTPSYVVGQLWFLFALLYDYLLFAEINKRNLHNYAVKVIPILFIFYICLAQGAHLAGIYVANKIYRNFLIEGFAFFMLGYWIHKNKEKLRVHNNILFFILILSTFLCLLERYLLGRDFGVNICTIPQVLCMFLLAINNTSDKETWLSKLGKRYSLYVYILHPFVWHSLERGFGIMGLDRNLFALYCLPILVVFFTLFLSHIVFKTHERVTLLRTGS